MKRAASYKSYIALFFALIVGGSLLFAKRDEEDNLPKEPEPFVVLLQTICIFSGAVIVMMIIICFTEKFSSCMCNVEKKTLSNIVKKFTARSHHIIIFTVTTGPILGVLASFYFGAYWNIMSTLIGIFVLASCLLKQEPTTVEISTMWENDNINVGYGLASQFFYGYIKLIMSADHDWESRIKSYSAEQDVAIFEKLIFLLPRSCDTKNTLTEADQRIVYAQSLEPKVVYLSGIRREFKSTVWKIDEGIRFVAEYPPPLSTIQDMCCKGIGHHLSNDMKREQLIIFCHHLQELVNDDPYCSSNCMIIQYDDYSDVPLSEIIDHHIEQYNLERARSAS